MLDLAPWLDVLDGENPSGRSLRDHPSFHDIERLMQPRVEVVRDERNNPVSHTTVPVDWAAVLAKAEDLRRHGRDLRLLAIVTRALANERGLAGLGDGLTLVARTLEAHWETLHPELKAAASPREAAVRRINALLQLQSDADGALGDLRRATVFVARGLGPVTGRELERGTLDARTVLAELASGLAAADQARITAEHEALVGRVRAACAAEADQRADQWAALLEGARGALDGLDALEAALAARLGAPVPLPELRRFLERTRATLKRAVPVPGAGPAAEASPEAERAAAAAPVAAAATNGAGLPDRLTSRQEVIACLDKIIEFYDRTEPASPVPFLARRMRRMVPMDFLELMEDLAPSGLKEFRSLAGIGDDKRAAARPQGEKT